MELKEKVAVITGGASGLGEATANEILANGGKVGILDVDEDRGKAFEEKSGGNAIFMLTDVTDEESVQKAMDAVVQKFGAIHVAVNCAGIATPGKVVGKKGPLPLATFNKVVQINLVGTFLVMQRALEKMMENEPNEDGERGVVINTASVAAFEGQIGQAAYASSKAGVMGMTLPCAREFAQVGVRVLCIAPGIFWTPMMAGLPEKAQEALSQMMPFPKRMGQPAEYAKLVRSLVENAYINGETIRLDAAIRMAAK
ncbi:MAG: SDR family NAD(P)-dependent oxidoreductase [Desulfatibacillaceae bacterium]